MNAAEPSLADTYRTLADGWRARSAESIGEQRRMMLEIAGQYEKLAFQLDRMARLDGDGT